MSERIPLGIEAVVDETAATVEIGTVETGEPNAPAEVKNSGDRYNARLDFVIPRGEKGEKGEKGNTPVKGTDYWTASEIEEINERINTTVNETVTEKLSHYDDASATKY